MAAPIGEKYSLEFPSILMGRAKIHISDGQMWDLFFSDRSFAD